MRTWEKIVTLVKNRPAKTAADRKKIQDSFRKILVRDKEILDRLADK